MFGWKFLKGLKRLFIHEETAIFIAVSMSAHTSYVVFCCQQLGHNTRILKKNNL
uniref:Uncharacterized protein n=1 Tax=Anguilla anguilla TaxID=7936 RepID=A0A0E9SXL8_ANGAN